MLNQKQEIKFLRSMIDSCFTYGNLSKDNSYIKKYKETLGEDLFNEVYDEHSQFLKDNFKVVHNVYTDHEGCTYNSLVEK